jgi:hypothetical protein
MKDFTRTAEYAYNCSDFGTCSPEELIQRLRGKDRTLLFMVIGQVTSLGTELFYFFDCFMWFVLVSFSLQH